MVKCTCGTCDLNKGCCSACGAINKCKFWEYPWYKGECPGWEKRAKILAPSKVSGSLPEEGENPSQTLARLAGVKMAELNLTYGQASDYILKTDPSLAKAYRDYTLTLLGG